MPNTLEKRINFAHCVSFHVYHLRNAAVVLFFSPGSFILDSFTFITSEEMNDFTLVGCFDWFECQILFLATHQTENFWVQFHALIVLYHLLIILRVSARFFQSFIFGSHLYRSVVCSMEVFLFGKSLCGCMPNFNAMRRVCVCVYGM